MKRDYIESVHESELFTAILALKTPDEARDFFYDLCTPVAGGTNADAKNALPENSGRNACQHRDYCTGRQVSE
jgi:hypothetical protein